MAVQYGSAEFFPQTWAVYRCRCGRAECEHGRRVGELPRGWHRLDVGGDDVPVCPACWTTVHRDASVTPPS